MRFVSLLAALDSKAKVKLLRILLDDNFTPMGERELSRLAGVSHMSAHRLLQEFQELDLTYVKRMGNTSVWHANTKGLAYAQLRKALELLSGDNEPRKQLVETITTALKPCEIIKVVLFGSVARGDEKASSDVDLFVLVENARDKAIVEEKLVKTQEGFLEKFGNPLNPYVLTRAEYAKHGNPRLLDEISKGMTLIDSMAMKDGRNSSTKG